MKRVRSGLCWQWRRDVRSIGGGVFDIADVSKNYDAEVWQLRQSEEIVEFTPGIFDLERADPAIVGKVWRSNPPARPPTGMGPPPVPIEWVMDGPEGEPNLFAEILNDAAKNVQTNKTASGEAKLTRRWEGAS
mgnify:CR=1 FL=1